MHRFTRGRSIDGRFTFEPTSKVDADSHVHELRSEMGKQAQGKTGGKRFFPSIRKEDAAAAATAASGDEARGFPDPFRKSKPKKKKADTSVGDDGDGGGSKEELEARLKDLLVKVEEFRAPEKKAARARIFRSIGKVRKSLQTLENGGRGEDKAAETEKHEEDASALKEPAAKKLKPDSAAAAFAAAMSKATAPTAPSVASVTRESKESRRKTKQRLQLLNKQISMHGQRKQLTKALRVFEQIRSEGLTPSDYTHTNLINAYVRSGDIDGAMQQLNDMQAAGAVPNVVTYTALIKGVCSIGNMAGAEALLARMAKQRPALTPNVRTINTMLRGCVRVGDVDLGYKVVQRMRDEWGLEPDGPCLDYMVKLLTQVCTFRPYLFVHTCADSHNR